MTASTLWRIRDRATFAAMRRSGRRARRGLVTVTWLAPDDRTDAGARVAFAVPGRSGAVVRNRVRRRLRAALAEAGPLQGAFLVSAGVEAASAPWDQLRHDLADAVHAASGQLVGSAMAQPTEDLDR